MVFCYGSPDKDVGKKDNCIDFWKGQSEQNFFFFSEKKPCVSTFSEHVPVEAQVAHLSHREEPKPVNCSCLWQDKDSDAPGTWK